MRRLCSQVIIGFHSNAHGKRGKIISNAAFAAERREQPATRHARRQTPHLWGFLRSIINRSRSSCSCDAPVFCARMRPSARDFSNGTGGGYRLHSLITQVTFSSKFRQKGELTQERRIAVTIMHLRGRHQSPARGLRYCRILVRGPPSVPRSLRASGDRKAK